MTKSLCELLPVARLLRSVLILLVLMKLELVVKPERKEDLNSSPAMLGLPWRLESGVSRPFGGIPLL